MLCSLCLDVLSGPLAAFVPEREHSDRGGDEFQSEPPEPQSQRQWVSSGSHHLSLASLRHSVEKKCHLCLEIWKAVTRKPRDLTRIEAICAETGSLGRCTFRYSPNSGGRLGTITFEQAANLGKGPSPDIALAGWKYVLELRPASEVNMGAADVDGSLSCGRKGPTDKVREQAEIALKWLRDCDESHAQCAALSMGDVRLPTRLIRVNGPTDSLVQVVDTRETLTTGPYITLSYCWGQSTTVRLLLTNLDKMKKTGFPTDSLPKTLRDAITFTRKLGISYLWIDSLCIIQDSIADWEAEAIKMGEVYSQSYCNLAATYSSECDGGLFWDENPYSVCPIVLTPQLQPILAEPVVLFDRNMWQMRIRTSSPLNNRGWVLQERLMALRTIHFTYDQILWECRQTRRAQHFHLRLPCDDEDWPGNKGKWVNIYSLRNLQAPVEGVDLKLLWNAIVHTYTTCRLTFPRDKLVAIGAIAAHIAAQTGDEYVAGLWRRDMPQNLAWTPMPYRGRLPPTYRSPSWSWAAIDGPVPISVPHYAENPTPLVAIETCTIRSATGSRFGPITGAELRLRGLLVPLWAYCESELWVSDWRVCVGAEQPLQEADFAQVARMMFCDVESPQVCAWHSLRFPSMSLTCWMTLRYTA
jgi:hypothetical protein